ncbi:MAG: amidase [Sorangiineae bacterium]|nr:amidase [Polyangiaceae bacterium]MEB2323156.1 amidase [Sorangiineae bacterium]
MLDTRLLSATAIARAIREGTLTSREAVEQHIEQIERVNPRINAVVRERFGAARCEADAADERRRAGGELPPLHGVPCTVKECFALTGMPQSAGLVQRRHVVAGEDATAVRRLRAAGAIPLGVTNTSELCMWMESNNFVYGRTRNPYDASRIAGGSSGGEGAIIGAGASPFGLGSDVGGSIRGPAFFNGVFGHKPTGGLVPNTGQFPLAENEGERYCTTGPLARRAEDLSLLLGLLAGPDGVEAGCLEIPLGDPAAVRLEGRTLLQIEGNGAIPVSADLKRAQRRALDALERRGMRVREMQFPALERQFDIWSAMMGAASETPFRALLGEGTPIRPLRELLKLAVGKSEHTLMATALALIEPLPKLFPESARRLVELGRGLYAELSEALGEGGALLYPSHSSPAPRHGEPVRQALRLHMPWAYLGIMNVLELPSTQVPLGLNDAGLPLGVQVASRRGNDHVTLAIARELERALGGWVPPPLSGLGR